MASDTVTPTLPAAGSAPMSPEDAVYPLAFVDPEGQPLNGANKYIQHFEKGSAAAGKCFLVGHHV